MSRRKIILIAAAVAAILTIVGIQACHYKVVPLVRIALWFPLPYLLDADAGAGVLLALAQPLLLVYAFALAIRRWRTAWVLMAFIVVYALYAWAVIAMLGPPR